MVQGEPKSTALLLLLMNSTFDDLLISLKPNNDLVLTVNLINRTVQN